MMKQLFLLIIIVTLFGNDLLYAQEWELRKNEEGIKVYTRQKGDSKVIEFKGITTVDAPVSALVEVLKDVGSYHLWMADLKIAKKLKTVNDNEWYAWYGAKVPWPLEDRDVVYRLRLFELDGSSVITLKSQPDFIPKNKDYVRINIAEGKWIFSPVGENKTNIMYQFYADPEMNVPLWITNLFIVDGPFETLKDLKEISMKGNYSN